MSVRADSGSVAASEAGRARQPTSSPLDFWLGVFLLTFAVAALPESFYFSPLTLGGWENIVSVLMLTALLVAGGQVLSWGLGSHSARGAIGLISLGLAFQQAVGVVVVASPGIATPGAAIETGFILAGALLAVAAALALAWGGVADAVTPRRRLERIGVPALAGYAVGVWLLPLTGLCINAILDHDLLLTLLDHAARNVGDALFWARALATVVTAVAAILAAAHVVRSVRRPEERRAALSAGAWAVGSLGARLVLSAAAAFAPLVQAGGSGAFAAGCLPLRATLLLPALALFCLTRAMGSRARAS